VEVLTSTALASVLLAIAVPQLPTLRAQFQIGAAAREIAINLQQARMKAVGENVYCRVVFNNNGSYVLQSSADGTSFTTSGPAVWLPHGVSFLGTLPDPIFNRLGVLGDSAAVAITNSLGATKTVQINILGKITIP
jgi:hypothetical protein